MGFEEELFHELATNTWDKRSRMQQEMVKGAKGEPFAVQELYRKGPLTPSLWKKESHKVENIIQTQCYKLASVIEELVSREERI